MKRVCLYFCLFLLLSSNLLFLGCDESDNGEEDSQDSQPNDDEPYSSDFNRSGDDDSDLPYSFPDGFLFGSATAGFQVDMGCPSLVPETCDDTNSDWYEFVTSAQTIEKWNTFLSGENPSVAGPGHWELYESDFELAKSELYNNAFRMSIEWSRIFPESTVGVDGYENLLNVADSEAVAHYHQVFSELRAQGLEPFVTLHHYTMPTWIHDAVGCTMDFDSCDRLGWLDPEKTVREIAKYAGFAAREYGSKVDLWGTQNEPFAVLLPGFLLSTPMRSNPPCRLLDAESFKTAFKAMVEAHARMVDEIRANDLSDADSDGVASMAGIVYAMAPVMPKDPANPLDVEAAENVFYLWNMAFLNAVSKGELDVNLDGNSEYYPGLAGRMDFIGLNYKMAVSVAGLPFPLLPWMSPLTNFNPLSIDMSNIYPQGIYDMSLLLKEQFDLPIFVTENNGQHVPKGDIETEKKYIVQNLAWLTRAIDQGADVRGYFYWAFMDNYEWNHGSTISLGLYRVDSDDPSKERIPRETVNLYGSIAKAGAIPAELIEQYPLD